MDGIDQQRENSPADSAQRRGPAHRATAHHWIERLGLQRHPEGGWYRELFRSTGSVERGGERRSALTSIYFLLERGQVGRWHQVASDEVWHFLAGDPLEVPAFDSRTGTVEIGRLGPLPDHVPFYAVRANWWQASRPLGEFALVGCTVGPGFDFADFCFVADLPAELLNDAQAFGGPLAPFRSLL